MLILTPLLLLAKFLQWPSFRKCNADIRAALSSSSIPAASVLDTLSLSSGPVCYAGLAHPGPERPTVLFVHGTPGSLDNFLLYLADPALRQQANLYAYDRPGFGHSGFGHALPRLEDQALVLKELADSLAARGPLILVGHSLGGSVLARFAMDHPDRADGLLMLSAAIDPDLEPPNGWRQVMAWPVFYPFVPTAFWVSNEELVILEDELRCLAGRWSEIRTPARFLHGTEDFLVPVANVDYARKELAGREGMVFDVLEGESHFFLWTRPGYVRRQIVELIDQASPETTGVRPAPPPATGK